MEGDFKRLPRRPDGIISGRSHPQPSQRPVTTIPVTDLGPPTVHQPAPAQPTTYTAPLPVTDSPATAPPTDTTAPSTAELIAQHERDSKTSKPNRRKLVLAITGLIIVIVAAFIFLHRPAAKATGPFPASISSSQITIPVFYPKNLPIGFKVSDSKVVKQDNLNYVVTSTNNDSFYVNIEAIPAGYDFVAFNKRFTNPISYQTDIGAATTGTMNNELVTSIQTPKSWVMINSTALKSAADMETVAKALKPASL